MLSHSLDGIVVLDFGQLIAAPVCGMWLADLGATVVKIEPPQGELARHLGPPAANGETIVLLASNRDKLGLSIDLKHPAAGPVIRRLVARADVVLQNFRPGVADRLGLGWEALKAVNPDLVYCAISAFGQDGAWRDRPGVDGIVQAASGIMSTVAGERGPGKVPLPLADMTGAMFAVIAILAALRARDGGRGGALLDIDLFGGMMMLQHLNLATYLTTGELPVPAGSAASYAAPNEAFPTADGWILVAAYQPARWTALCRILGCPELAADPRFHSNDARLANREAMRAALDPHFRTRTSAEWSGLLLAGDVMAAPVATYAEVVASPAYRPQKAEAVTCHPTGGRVVMPAFAFDAARAGAQRPAPMLGQHTADVLARLGFSPPEIADLVARRVVMQGRAA